MAMATADDFFSFPIRKSATYPWLGFGEEVLLPIEADILDALRGLQPGDPLPKGPLLRMVEPDAHDTEVLRLAYALTGEKTNKTLEWVYGGKNGRVSKWLHQATGKGVPT